MNQWSVYPASALNIGFDFETNLPDTGSRLSKKVVAGMAANYEYRGSLGQSSFQFDFSEAPKRGYGIGYPARDIEYCRALWVKADYGSAYAFEWKDYDTQETYILSPVELAIQ